MGPNYKWVALTNTTVGILMVVMNGSITIIALPDIFRGIKLDPLQPGNAAYFLWLLMGFLLVTSVLVLSFGRIGDMYGRVRMYNLGFAIFTVFSILLSITWMHGTAGAIWLIVMRLFQGVGGALEFANSSAILTDAFPENQRGLALGINGVAAISGSFIGLILGGVLAPISWRLVFLVSVPFGVFGTVWAYTRLVDNGVRKPGRIDWKGNVVFALGLTSLLVGVVYGIQPYGGHAMGWTNPEVLAALVAGVVLLVVFVFVEQRVEQPMFKLELFRIRPFAAGNIAALLSALSRGGLQFMLVIWLQGIWLPQHGYDFTQTPLWAGIYMVPLTVGFLLAGPTSGILSDRFGARGFATAGMLGTATAFALLEELPVNFSYVWFALLLLVMGLSMGMFASPNRAAIMNSLPPDQRGAGAGMATTFQNSAMVLSIGVFFTVITIGLASALPRTLYQGLRSAGMADQGAVALSHAPPIGTLFASMLGYNPIQKLLQTRPQFSAGMTPGAVARLESRSYFPHLISGPFGTGLHYAFTFAIVASLVAAVASLLRGKHGTRPARPLAEAAEEGMAAESVITLPSVPAAGS